MKKEMSAEYVLNLYCDFENMNCPVWVDGGWGVDALLGYQSRPHADLDIALEHKHVEKLREYLTSLGYRDVERDDTSKWNFVMGDEHGHEIDFHAFVLDSEGKVIDGLKYPDGSLTGEGFINGKEVRTIDPAYMIKFHSGYTLKEKDFKDVSALCAKFGIDLPEEFSSFKEVPTSSSPLDRH